MTCGYAPNFTLNLGLRYEFDTTFQDAHGNTSALLDVRNQRHNDHRSPI